MSGVKWLVAGSLLVSSAAVGAVVLSKAREKPQQKATIEFEGIDQDEILSELEIVIWKFRIANAAGGELPNHSALIIRDNTNGTEEVLSRQTFAFERNPKGIYLSIRADVLGMKFADADKLRVRSGMGLLSTRAIDNPLKGCQSVSFSREPVLENSEMILMKGKKDVNEGRADIEIVYRLVYGPMEPLRR